MRAGRPGEAEPAAHALRRVLLSLLETDRLGEWMTTMRGGKGGGVGKKGPGKQQKQKTSNGEHKQPQNKKKQEQEEETPARSWRRAFVGYFEALNEWVQTGGAGHMQEGEREQRRAIGMRTLMEFVVRGGMTAVTGAGKPSGSGRKSLRRRFDPHLYGQLVRSLLTASPPLPDGLQVAFHSEYCGAYHDCLFHFLQAVPRAVVAERASRDPVALQAMAHNTLCLLARVQLPDRDAEITSFLVDESSRSKPNKRRRTTPTTPTEEEDDSASSSSDSDSDSDSNSDSDSSASSTSSSATGDEEVEEDEDGSREQGKDVRGNADRRNRKRKPARSSHMHKAARYHTRFTDAWIEALRLPLTPALFKRVLVHLPDHVIPNMTNPLGLADFLTDSYNQGGVISILALNSLLLLMEEYNLEYPAFFPQLYRVVTRESFHSKYRPRFFRLLFRCLRSTHLPSYIIAAFLKRINKFSMTASPSAALFGLALSINLLVRHPQCKVLVHRPNVAQTGGSDESKASSSSSSSSSSSNNNNNNSASSGGSHKGNAGKKKRRKQQQQQQQQQKMAVDASDPTQIGRNHLQSSSLWELEGMRRHYLHSVSAFPEGIRNHELDHSHPLAMRADADDLAAMTYVDLFEQELRRKVPGASGHDRAQDGAEAAGSCPLEYRKPTSALPEDSLLGQLFQIPS